MIIAFPSWSLINIPACCGYCTHFMEFEFPVVVFVFPLWNLYLSHCSQLVFPPQVQVEGFQSWDIVWYHWLPNMRLDYFHCSYIIIHNVILLVPLISSTKHYQSVFLTIIIAYSRSIPIVNNLTVCNYITSTKWYKPLDHRFAMIPVLTNTPVLVSTWYVIM